MLDHIQIKTNSYNVDKDYCEAYDWEIRKKLHRIKESFLLLNKIYDHTKHWANTDSLVSIRKKVIDSWILEDFRELCLIEREIWRIINRIDITKLNPKIIDLIDNVLVMINGALDYMEKYSYYETLKKFHTISRIYENIDILSDIYKRVLLKDSSDKINIIVEEQSWKRKDMLDSFEEQLSWDLESFEDLKEKFLSINKQLPNVCLYGNYSSFLISEINSLMLSVTKWYSNITYPDFKEAIIYFFDLIDFLSSQKEETKKVLYENQVKSRNIIKMLRSMIEKQRAKTNIIWNIAAIKVIDVDITKLKQEIEEETDELELQKLNNYLALLDEQVSVQETWIMKYFEEAMFTQKEKEDFLEEIDALYILEKIK